MNDDFQRGWGYGVVAGMALLAAILIVLRWMELA